MVVARPDRSSKAYCAMCYTDIQGGSKKVSCCTVSTAYFFEPPCRFSHVQFYVIQYAVAWLICNKPIKEKKYSEFYDVSPINCHHLLESDQCEIELVVGILFAKTSTRSAETSAKANLVQIRSPDSIQTYPDDLKFIGDFLVQRVRYDKTFMKIRSAFPET